MPEKRSSFAQCKNQKLKKKLHEAVRYISQLTKENEKLSEIGNKLRHQWVQINPETFQTPGIVSQYIDINQIEQIRAKPKTKLQSLEDMHYNIASEELSNEIRKMEVESQTFQKHSPTDTISLNKSTQRSKKEQQTNDFDHGKNKVDSYIGTAGKVLSDNNVSSVLNANASSTDISDVTIQRLWQMIDNDKGTYSSDLSI